MCHTQTDILCHYRDNFQSITIDTVKALDTWHGMIGHVTELAKCHGQDI